MLAATRLVIAAVAGTLTTHTKEPRANTPQDEVVCDGRILDDEACIFEIQADLNGSGLESCMLTSLVNCPPLH